MSRTTATPATEGQYKKLWLALLDQAPLRSELDKEIVEFWLKNQDQLKQVLNDALSQKLVVKDNSILRLLTTADKPVVKALDGQRFLAKAKNTFKSYVSGDFEEWGLDKKSSPTPATAVDVYELTKDAIFAKIFGSFGRDLDSLCLSQDQIEEFCLTYSDKLRQDGYATFFLFKENNEFFVARVGVYSDGLRVSVFRLGYGSVWNGKYLHLVVIPAQL